MQHPQPCSPRRGRKTPHRKGVPRSALRPRVGGRDLAPGQLVPALRPQQARSSRVHMASGVHMARSGPFALPAAGARDGSPAPLPPAVARPAPPQARPSARPPASPPAKWRELRDIPGAARGAPPTPGRAALTPPTPRTPPAHTRRRCTRGCDEQVPFSGTLRPGPVPTPGQTETPQPPPQRPDDSRPGPFPSTPRGQGRPLLSARPGRVGPAPQHPESWPRNPGGSAHSQVGQGKDLCLPPAPEAKTPGLPAPHKPLSP